MATLSSKAGTLASEQMVKTREASDSASAEIRKPAGLVKMALAYAAAFPEEIKDCLDLHLWDHWAKTTRFALASTLSRSNT